MYVGKSVNLQHRWQGANHHRYRQATNLAFPRLAYIQMPEAKIHTAERRLIGRLNAPWNGTSVPKQTRLWKFGVEVMVAMVVCYLAGQYHEELLEMFSVLIGG